jgi:hypothetical protein
VVFVGLEGVPLEVPLVVPLVVEEAHVAQEVAVVASSTKTIK